MIRRTTSIAVIGALLGLGIAVPAGAAPPGDPGVSSTPETEDLARDLEEAALASGSLGLYADADTGELVVVYPKTATARAAAVLPAGLAHRVETSALDQATIDQIDDELIALHEQIARDGFAYSFGPDLENGVVAITSDAPKSAFASVLKAHPGLVTYRKGKVEQTAWDNDGQPHWGGAWVQSSSQNCTAGWAMENANGTRWMVTAGHCFPNGVSTNMGTSIRDDGYNNWSIDVARLKGHTYAGRIYADGATGDRKVKDGNDPVVGSSYCVTGRSSGFHCGWVVKAKNHTACYSEPAGVPCFKQLAAVTRSGSPSVVQKGDSGGPFYIKNGTDGVGVRGIVSGRTLVDSVNPGGWTSLIQQYRSIADFYVSHAVTQ